VRREHALCTADDAVALIKGGATVASGGFVGAAHPEALTAALERRFLASGLPHDLTLVYAAGQGDGKSRGLNHLAHAGLLRRVVGGHWGLAPRLGKLAVEGAIEAICFPQGVLCQLFRDIAAGRPGCITHIGLDTFVDPVHQGGRLNDRTPEGAVERVQLGDRQWLWYKSFPIDVALVRATAADPCGNLLMTEEVLRGEVLALAQAAHNCGGIVLAQVGRLLEQNAEPHAIAVPGVLVDRIVVADAGEHQQTFAEPYNPAYTSAAQGCRPAGLTPPLPFGVRRIIASRACDETPEGAIANLGIGMPEGIARIAAERGWLDRFTLTVESGPIGGMPAGGLSFGASHYPQAIVDQPAQFDFYDGRGLDFAALGAAQVDRHGNVNVARFGDRVAGIGGFANITQTARKLVFCLTFRSGDTQVEMRGGQLVVLAEAGVCKFVDQVDHRSFSAARSRQLGQDVLYVTERAVFRLADAGLELIELAPGLDLERDVIAHMGFRPIIGEVVPMPASAFAPPGAGS
jgi:propionate CoA-transferase